MPPRDVMTIGEFSRRTRITVKALRLYDRQGLLSPSFVDRDSGYRYYRSDQIPVARLVEHLRRIDMPMQHIGEVLDAPRDEAVAAIARYWDGVEQRVAMQRRLAEHLWISLSGHHGGYPAFPCATREVPSRTLLIIEGDVFQREIAGFADHGFGRLRQIAHPRGWTAGYPHILYHGVVGDDEPAPIELALPVALDATVPDDIPHRIEPAHREVFTTITRASLEYPQILSAYDAVYVAIETHGSVQAGPPREIYLADVATAVPDEPVCEIAVPVT
jgi:DNA-binding transcriptional MerR regulator/effector-binding domain-containing protein